MRRYLLEAARGNREIQRGLIAACREDILLFINLFVFQFNPDPPEGANRVIDRMGPFITWDFQDRALLDTPETTGHKGILWCVRKRRGAVIEKARKQGASWLFLIVQAWLCTFHQYVDCLCVSRSADAVDDKTKKSLFAKLRFILENLPDWMKGPIADTSMYLHWKKTHSEITGEASTSRSGVGGRGSPILIDEFAEIREDTAVRNKTAMTGGCRFFVSTHLGVNTEFYKLTTNPDYVKIVMHWTAHPHMNQGLYSYDMKDHKVRFWRYDKATGKIVEKPHNDFDYGADFHFVKDGTPTGGIHPGIRSPWYDKACIEIGDSHGVAMQLDIDPKGAARQFFDPILIARLKRSCLPPRWEGVLDHDEQGNPVRLAEVPGGPIKLWCELDADGQPPKAAYGGGCDISGGRGKTPSCFTLTNGVTGAKVLEYVNSRIEPKDFGSFVVALCKMFVDANGNLPKIAWEHHGPGTNFGAQVIELKYTNVYRKVSVDRLGHPRSNTMGWNPNQMGMMLRDYHHALSRGEFQNLSEPALDECLSFEHDGRGGVVNATSLTEDAEDARENHGDRVVADGLSWLICKDMGKLTTQKAAKMQAKDKDPVAYRRSMAYRFELEAMEAEQELVWESD